MKQEKTKKRSYRKYDESFKMEAVNQMKQGRSVGELASRLGVGAALLYRWKAQSDGKGKINDDEIKALKKALKQTKEDNEILKKALSIFSQSG
jgi:transposase